MFGIGIVELLVLAVVIAGVLCIAVVAMRMSRQ